MKELKVSINQREYRVACADAQEHHLQSLADYIDRKTQDMARSVGQVGEAKLLVLSALMIADELSSVMTELDTVKAQLRSLEDQAAGQITTVNPLADRLEALAAKLENA